MVGPHKIPARPRVRRRILGQTTGPRRRSFASPGDHRIGTPFRQSPGRGLARRDGPSPCSGGLSQGQDAPPPPSRCGLTPLPAGASPQGDREPARPLQKEEAKQGPHPLVCRGHRNGRLHGDRPRSGDGSPGKRQARSHRHLRGEEAISPMEDGRRPSAPPCAERTARAWIAAFSPLLRVVSGPGSRPRPNPARHLEPPEGNRLPDEGPAGNQRASKVSRVLPLLPHRPPRGRNGRAAAMTVALRGKATSSRTSALPGSAGHGCRRGARYSVASRPQVGYKTDRPRRDSLTMPGVRKERGISLVVSSPPPTASGGFFPHAHARQRRREREDEPA